jgi:predicted chitinase
MCGIAVSKGGFITLDDFEGPPTVATPLLAIGLHWPDQDGRTGSWQQFSAATPPARLEVAATDTTGGSPASKQAIHFTGGPGTFGATMALPMGNNCYDASAYDGVSFWLKGNPAAGTTRVHFNVQTPVSEPVASGGACVSGCSDHFEKIVDVTPTWTQYRIKWTDLTLCGSPTPAIPTGFEPHKMILSLSFSQDDKTKGFDFFVDDITFDVDTRPANSFGDIVTQAIFNEMFKFAPPQPVFTYAGLVDAVRAQGQGQLALSGTPLDRKHEAAGLMAQIDQETGGLTVVREAACSPVLTPMCTTNFPGSTEVDYFGRGAMQLTHRANYDAANAVFPGISATPDLVAQQTSIAWGTAVWFWMTRGCHEAMTAQDFGGTTLIINGGLECGAGPNRAGAIRRGELYRRFAAGLGINARGTLVCP